MPESLKRTVYVRITKADNLCQDHDSGQSMPESLKRTIYTRITIVDSLWTIIVFQDHHNYIQGRHHSVKRIVVGLTLSQRHVCGLIATADKDKYTIYTLWGDVMIHSSDDNTLYTAVQGRYTLYVVSLIRLCPLGCSINYSL